MPKQTAFDSLIVSNNGKSQRIDDKTEGVLSSGSEIKEEIDHTDITISDAKRQKCGICYNPVYTSPISSSFLKKQKDRSVLKRSVSHMICVQHNS